MKRISKRAVAASAMLAASALVVQSASADLVAYYSFNDSSNGAVVPDDSGNGHAGTPVGNAMYTAGGGAPIGDGGGGNAFMFDGAGDAVSLDVTGTANPFSTLSTNNAGTVAFWTLTGSANQTHFGLYNGGTRQFQAHVPWGDNTVYFDTGGCCNGGEHRISKGITDGGYDFMQWHHWAFVKEGDTNTIYRDGVLFHSGTATADLGAITAAFIGAASATGAESVNGKMDDFIVFNNALTEADVDRLIAEGGDAFVPEPAGLGLLAVGGLAALGRRRRARRA